MALAVFASGQRLERLIQNHLLYTRVEMIAADPSDLRLIRSVPPVDPSVAITLQASAKAEASGRKDDLDVETEQMSVSIAEEHVEKIVEELMDNAIKFSQPGTALGVTTFAEKSWFKLVVTDAGVGMTREQIT